MTLKEFKALDVDMQIKLANKRINEATPENFKCEELNFTYALLLKHFKTLNLQKCEDNTFIKPLSKNELETLHLLASEYNYLKDTKYNLGRYIKERNSADIKTTTFRIDKKVAANWQNFCKRHSSYAANELLNSALEEFMRYHDNI